MPVPPSDEIPSVPDSSVVEVISPDADKISPVIMLRSALRVIFPPSPSTELESTAPALVLIPPALLTIAIFPPVPVPLAAVRREPVIISDVAFKAIAPPSPDSELVSILPAAIPPDAGILTPEPVSSTSPVSLTLSAEACPKSGLPVSNCGKETGVISCKTAVPSDPPNAAGSISKLSTCPS